MVDLTFSLSKARDYIVCNGSLQVSLWRPLHVSYGRLLHEKLLHETRWCCSAVPLTRVDVDTGAKADRVSRDCIGSYNGHIVPLKADRLVHQGACIDYPEAVCLSGHDCDVVMAAARVAWRSPGLLN